jgi:hypothetical protein
MTSARVVRSAVTVSTGALALCLFSTGVAAADTPLPPLPSPGNVITTLDQTITQVTGTDPTTLTDPGSTTPGTTTPGTTTPGTTTPGTTTPGTTTPGTTTAGTTTKTPTTAKHASTQTTLRRPRTTAPAPQPQTVPAPASYAAMMPAPVAGDLALPPATTVTSAAGQTPAVAPLLIPQATHPISPAAALIEADKHTGSPIRAILLTLAIAAAIGVGYEHVRLVGRELRV